MATFAPPVLRGNFLYSSMLYVDVGSQNLHPRASIAELTDLLRPETPNRTKKVKPPQEIESKKDRVGHWYTAQLVHYGLPPTKDKNTAKVRLLSALNEGKLDVPAWITRLEVEIKKEWESEKLKLKKSTKNGRIFKNTATPQTKARQKKGPKTPASQPPKPSSVSTVNKPTASSGTPAPISSQGKRKRGDTDEVKPAGFGKFAKPKEKDEPKDTPKFTPSSMKKKAATDETLTTRADEDVCSASRKNKIPYSPAKRLPLKKEKDSREPKASKSQIKKENITPQSKPRASLQKASRTIEPQAQQDINPGDMIFSGTYKITCPDATKIFPNLDPSSLRLTLCKDNDRWWASFSWDFWNCVIQMNPGPSYETLDQPCTLGWRLRDHASGQLRFGRGCVGNMTFYRDQTIRAYLFDIPLIGMAEFWGPRLSGPRGVGRSGEDYRKEWDSFVTDVYG